MARLRWKTMILVAAVTAAAAAAFAAYQYRPLTVAVLQPERKAEENAPDRDRRVDQGGFGRCSHAHSEREGDVVGPHSDEAYTRQGEEVPPTRPSVPRLEERYEREEQEPRQGEPHRYEGEGRELGDGDFDGHRVGTVEEDREE